MIRTLFLCLICILFNTNAFSQSNTDSSQTIFFVAFDYGYYSISGDWEERFSQSNSVGGAIGLKLANNWQVKISASGLFSNRVKVNGLLNDVINEAGDATDSDGELVKIIYEQRGFNSFIQFSKTIRAFNLNPNSGILLQAGIGYLQHKIKIDYRDGTVFQLEEEDIKGYDRLHSGIATNQFIGIQYFGKRNLFNFYGGFEMGQAFTKNRREYNYDTRDYDKASKVDLYYGIKLGWMIPFKKRASEEFYYY